MAFALALPLPRGKHTHVRDLVYASGNDDVAQGMRENKVDAPEETTMFVRLNLEGDISLKRTFSMSDQVSE